MHFNEGLVVAALPKKQASRRDHKGCHDAEDPSGKHNVVRMRFPDHVGRRSFSCASASAAVIRKGYGVVGRGGKILREYAQDDNSRSSAAIGWIKRDGRILASPSGPGHRGVGLEDASWSRRRLGGWGLSCGGRGLVWRRGWHRRPCRRCWGSLRR